MLFMKRCCTVSRSTAVLSPKRGSTTHTCIPFGITFSTFVESFLLRLLNVEVSSSLRPKPSSLMELNDCALAKTEVNIANIIKSGILFIDVLLCVT